MDGVIEPVGCRLRQVLWQVQPKLMSQAAGIKYYWERMLLEISQPVPLIVVFIEINNI